jgi:hypothetical protein
MTGDDTANKRDAAREAVLKGAQIRFHDSVADCVVLNISTKGARVRTASVMPLPEQVTLRLRGGATISALCRWTQGTVIGLEFVGALSFAEERAIRAREILEVLRGDGLHSAIEHLRTENFFDDPELAQASENAEAAHQRLEAVLLARAGEAA